MKTKKQILNKAKMVGDDGEIYVAVLVSYGYGAGWSSWNCGHDQLLFDPIVVNHIAKEYGTPLSETKYSGIMEYLQATYPDCYFGGFHDLGFEWVKEGDKFFIDEYDGNESLVTERNINFITA